MDYLYLVGAILCLLILFVPLLIGMGLAIALKLTGFPYYGATIGFACIIWGLITVYIQK